MSRRKRKKDRLKDEAIKRAVDEVREGEGGIAAASTETSATADEPKASSREDVLETQDDHDEEKALALALEQRVMKPTEEHVSYDDDKDDEVDEDVDGDEAGNGEEEEVRETNVEEVKKEERVSKKELVIILIALIAIAAFLVFSEWRSAKTDTQASALGTVSSLTFENKANNYSFEYPSDFQLIAEGSIPQEMSEALGISEMADLNLNDSDALLIENRAELNENIVYTVLNLSRNENFISRIAYEDSLLAEIEALTEGNTDAYSTEEVLVGPDEVSGTQISFSTQVEIAPDVFRTGRFYDTIFEYGGDTYSISFGYPVDAASAERYLESYNDLIDSFDFLEEVSE